MQINVNIPSQLAAFTGGQRAITVKAASLSAVFSELDSIAPMLRSQMFYPQGQLRQFVGLFVDNVQVIDVVNEQVPLRDGSQVLIIFSVAGG